MTPTIIQIKVPLGIFNIICIYFGPLIIYPVDSLTELLKLPQHCIMRQNKSSGEREKKKKPSVGTEFIVFSVRNENGTVICNETSKSSEKQEKSSNKTILLTYLPTPYLPILS
jgi:hypothetical protein